MKRDNSLYINDTIVALATASGVGAIAVIRLSGKEAIAIADSMFKPYSRKSLLEAPSHTVHLGTLESKDQVIDECLATIFKGTKSYTGEPVVEFSCHGSNYIVEEVIKLCLAKGARLADAGEFTKRAFLNGKLALNQAEAVADLIASDSKASHQVALQQMRGGFTSEIEGLRQELLNFTSLIELELDFSEEDVEFADRTQFKALLRASKYGQIKIMLPMIMDIGEIRKAKAIFEECKKELQEKEIEFDKNIMLGIMVETPAVAFRAKYFAKECDFFSIGTNDLTQYTLAVDRGNEKIANLYDTYNPSVLQAIKMLIDGAHEGGIKISMCGEFAGDENAVALLFGMGLDAFSMSGISIPRVKRIIMKFDKRECQNLVERVLSLSTASEIKEEVKKFMEKI